MDDDDTGGNGGGGPGGLLVAGGGGKGLPTIEPIFLGKVLDLEGKGSSLAVFRVGVTGESGADPLRSKFFRGGATGVGTTFSDPLGGRGGRICWASALRACEVRLGCR